MLVDPKLHRILVDQVGAPTHFKGGKAELLKQVSISRNDKFANRKKIERRIGECIYEHGWWIRYYPREVNAGSKFNSVSDKVSRSGDSYV